MKNSLRRLLEEQMGASMKLAAGIESSVAGRTLVRAGIVVGALSRPVSCLIVMLLATAVPTFAADTGPVFNGNASNLSNIIRSGLLLAAAIVVAVGVAFGFKAIVNFGSDKEWSKQAIAAVLCFAASTVLAVMWAIAQGQVVDVGYDF